MLPRLLVSLLLVTACTGPRAPGHASGEAGSGSEADAVVSLRDLGDGFVAASFPTMGTEVQLILGAGAATAAAATAAAQAELARLDALLSEWRADSPLSAVNRAAGARPVEVPQELFDLVAHALGAAAASDGAFDPTWASMRGLWKFGDAMDGSVPTDEAIEGARALVDFRRVRLDAEARTIELEAGQALGLGGIAKGYAVDRLTSIFRQMAIEHFVVRLGGDLYAAGSRGDRPWRVGVQDPRAPEAHFATLEVRDRAFSTSGDYERFFVRDGVRYHHLIDPATGRPAAASRSVSALCPDAITAEVVTKPVFIRGPSSLPWAETQGCEVVLVDAANRVHLTTGLAGRLVWTPPTP